MNGNIQIYAESSSLHKHVGSQSIAIEQIYHNILVQVKLSAGLIII